MSSTSKTGITHTTKILEVGRETLRSGGDDLPYYRIRYHTDRGSWRGVELYETGDFFWFPDHNDEELEWHRLTRHDVMVHILKAGTKTGTR